MRDFVLFKQKTAYEMRISDWSSDVCSSDLVITTALIPGRPAPRLISDAQIATMRAGSVIVDLAAESGGNVEGVVSGQTVVRHGVKRSEERRVGKECVSACRSRRSP